MKKKEKKVYLQEKKRYLKKIVGSPEKPRLSVFRSHKHIYAQLIDDTNSLTLVSFSTLEKEIKEKMKSKESKKSSANKESSFLVGKKIGQKAKEKSIISIVFDKGKRAYHGRIKSLAEGAREAGLYF